jgi:flagellar hook protein FlgE
VGGAIEASNVDMATEFTNLIVYQRGYQANSKVVTTINQMDQTLLAINP